MNTEQMTYIDRARRIVERCDHRTPPQELPKVPHSALITAAKLGEFAVKLDKLKEMIYPAYTNPALWPKLYPQMIEAIGELASGVSAETLHDANHELRSLVADFEKTREIMRVAEELERAGSPHQRGVNE